MRAMLLIAIGLSLSACALPTTEEITQANIGPRPENAQQLIKEHFGRTLFDPYSAVYTFDYGPQRGYFMSIEKTIGWVVCGTVNAKNRLGGYVGAQSFRAIIVDGRVADYPASMIGDGVICQM